MQEEIAVGLERIENVGEVRIQLRQSNMLNHSDADCSIEVLLVSLVQIAIVQNFIVRIVIRVDGKLILLLQQSNNTCHIYVCCA